MRTKNILNFVLGIFFLFGLGKEVVAIEKIATMVNPVRPRSMWIDKTVKPLIDQYELIKSQGMKATWLWQNDIWKDEELVAKAKRMGNEQEMGMWLEITKETAYESRVYFDEEKPWYDPSVVFLSGYSREDRIKLIDTMMNNFYKVWGKYPKSVGAWWIDGFSQEYLTKKYGVTTFLICADQKSTDNYGIWGQWWGFPYHPEKNNILVPGESRELVIQWALRDPVKAYYGEGKSSSNYSLQANDYTSLGLKTDYFKKLVNIYMDNRNKLGQVTVGLETGMESVNNLEEYQKQLEYIHKENIVTATMDETGIIFNKIYNGRNPEKVFIDSWELSAEGRENKKLEEKIVYQKDMVFGDYYEADKSGFLSRIIGKSALLEKKDVIKDELILLGLIIGGSILGWKLKGVKWWAWLMLLTMVVIGSRLRLTIIENELIIGVLIDNFKFLGVNFKSGLVWADLSNLIARSMLMIKFGYWEKLTQLLIFVMIGAICKALIDRKK